MAIKDYVPKVLRTILGLGRVSNATLLNAGSIQPGGSRRVVRPLTDEHEYGVTGTENFGGYIRSEDFNPELDDFQRAVKIYDKMRRTDATIRSMLQVIKLPLRGATWLAVPPEGGDPVDQQIADFVNKALFDDDAMTDSWDYVLRHVLLQLDHGFSVLELVWRAGDDGSIRLKRLAPRLAKTIREWHVNRDGSLRAIVQYAAVPFGTERVSTTHDPSSGRLRPPTFTTSVNFQWLTIPADVAAVFVLEREGDNYEGTSILRNVYRNFWFKDQAYRINAIGIDRWAAGIPVAELSEGHNMSDGDLDDMVKILKAVRANEKSFLVAPIGVKYRIIPEGARGSNEVMAWIDHHDSQIARNVLAGFLTMGRDPKGTLGFGSRLTDMFVSSLNGVAKGISGDLKKQVVRPLCTYNFDMSKRQLPTILCRDLEQVDLENLVNVLAELAGTLITPDDDIESMLRKMLRVPPLAPENTRQAAAEAQQVATAVGAVPPGITPPENKGAASQAPPAATSDDEEVS